jgi:RNA-directed DNA polymerase
VSGDVHAGFCESRGVRLPPATHLVVVCPTQARAEEARRRAGQILGRIGLRLHPDKTRISCVAKGRDGFDFLGFHHHLVESWKWRGRWYLHRWPSDRAMASVRSKVRELTDRRSVGVEVETVVAMLNRRLRGWGSYFRWGNSARKFHSIDTYVHERLVILMSTKHGLRRSRNWSRFDWEWLQCVGVYQLTGTVRSHPANALR